MREKEVIGSIVFINKRGLYSVLSSRFECKIVRFTRSSGSVGADFHLEETTEEGAKRQESTVA